MAGHANGGSNVDVTLRPSDAQVRCGYRMAGEGEGNKMIITTIPSRLRKYDKINGFEVVDVQPGNGPGVFIITFSDPNHTMQAYNTDRLTVERDK
jgi:hypothetical protein